MSVASPIAQRLWTRSEYHAADRAGAFGPDERLELIEGRIIPKVSPQSHPHAAAISITADLLRETFGRGYHVREEKPIILNDRSEPEPDIVVVKGRARDFRDHPSPEDIILLIEVSDSRLGYDLGDKAMAYAAAGISEYWVLDIARRRLEVFRKPLEVVSQPLEFEYREHLLFLEGDCVELTTVPGISLSISDMLPSDLSPSRTA